jgi:hypothetical protein
MGKDCSAKSSLQQAFLFQIVQIVADGDQAYLEPVGQLIHVDGSGFFQKLQDLLTSRFGFHSFSLHQLIIKFARRRELKRLHWKTMIWP